MPIKRCKQCGRPLTEEPDGELWCVHCTPILTSCWVDDSKPVFAVRLGCSICGRPEDTHDGGSMNHVYTSCWIDDLKPNKRMEAPNGTLDKRLDRA